MRHDVSAFLCQDLGRHTGARAGLHRKIRLHIAHESISLGRKSTQDIIWKHILHSLAKTTFPCSGGFDLRPARGKTIEQMEDLVQRRAAHDHPSHKPRQDPRPGSMCVASKGTRNNGLVSCWLPCIPKGQGCGIKGFIPISVIQGTPLYTGFVFGKPFL